jgi:predicted transcriptional regulator
MSATTTLKLPEKLKARIARLAKETGRSAHCLMMARTDAGVVYNDCIGIFPQI